MDIEPLLRSAGAWSVTVRGTGGAHSLVNKACLAGTLRKLSGHFTKSFEERLVVALPCVLLLNFDSAEDATPRGVAVVTAASSVEVGPVGEQAHVITVGASSFACASRHEAAEWCEALIRHRSHDVVNIEKEALEKELASLRAERDASAAVELTARRAREVDSSMLAARFAALEAEAGSLRGQLDDVQTALQLTAERLGLPLVATERLGLPLVAADEAAAGQGGRQEAPVGPGLQAVAARVVSVAREVAQRSAEWSSAQAAQARTVLDQTAALRLAGEAIESGKQELADITADWADRDRKWATSVQLLTSRLGAEHERARILAGELLLSRQALADKAAALAEQARKYNSLAQEHRKCYSLRRATSSGAADLLVGEEGGRGGTASASALSSPGAPSPSQPQPALEGNSVESGVPRPPLHRQRSASFHGSSAPAVAGAADGVGDSGESVYGTPGEGAAAAPVSASAGSGAPSSLTPSKRDGLVAMALGEPAEPTACGALAGAAGDAVSGPSAPAVVFSHMPPSPLPRGTAPRAAADPFPGRLHILAVAARCIPSESFGSFGARHAYVRVRASPWGPREPLAAPHVECSERRTLAVQGGGGGGGPLPRGGTDSAHPPAHPLLNAQFGQAFALRVAGSITGATLRVELLAHRAMRADVVVGAASLDLSPLADWPSQAHAVWVILRPQGDPKAGSPDPAEVLVPVGSAAAASAGSQVNEMSVPARLKWAARDLPPPPADESICVILLQGMFCLHAEEVPRFFFPAPPVRDGCSSLSVIPGVAPLLPQPPAGPPTLGAPVHTCTSPSGAALAAPPAPGADPLSSQPDGTPAPALRRKASVVDPPALLSAHSAAARGAADPAQQSLLLQKLDVLKHAVRELRAANADLEGRLQAQGGVVRP